MGMPKKQIRQFGDHPKKQLTGRALRRKQIKLAKKAGAK